MRSGALLCRFAIIVTHMIVLLHELSSVVMNLSCGLKLWCPLSSSASCCWLEVFYLDLVLITFFFVPVSVSVCLYYTALCDCDYYSQITRRTRPQVRHGSVFETRPDPVSTLGNIKKTNEVVKKVCVEPRPSALNMTLPAFAAERRRLQEIAGTWCRRPQQHRSITPARISAARAAAVDWCDGRTDGRLAITWTLPRILSGQRQHFRAWIILMIVTAVQRKYIPFIQFKWLQLVENSCDALRLLLFVLQKYISRTLIDATQPTSGLEVTHHWINRMSLC